MLQFSGKYSSWKSVIPDTNLRGEAGDDTGATLLVVPIPTAEWGACNAVFANGVLVVRNAQECPQAFGRYEQYVKMVGAQAGVHQLIAVPASQVALVDGALTCCSVLLGPYATSAVE